MTRFLMRTSLATALIFALGTASAFPVTVTGTTDPDNTSALVDAPSISATSLQISVENTSTIYPGNIGSVITAFAFSLYDGLANALATVNGTLQDGDWTFAVAQDADSGNGTFDLNLESYAITGSNVNGGNPQSGIAAGGIGLFDFTGTFGSNVGLAEIFVRWQQTGSDGEGSDYGSVVCAEGNSCMKVSEPASWALFGLGLVVAGVATRRRRSQI